MKRTLLWRRARRGNQLIRLTVPHYKYPDSATQAMRYILPQHVHVKYLPKKSPVNHFRYKLIK